MWCSVARRGSVRLSTMPHRFMEQWCAVGNEKEDCFRVDLSLFFFFFYVALIHPDARLVMRGVSAWLFV